MTSRPSARVRQRTLSFSAPRWRVLAIAGCCAWLPLTVFAADAASPAPGAATSALENLRAANVARADLATAENAWRLERERLQAVIAATRAEATRLERDATAAETRRDQATAEIATLNATDELDALRRRLGDAAVRLRSALASLARTMPPGTIAIPTEEGPGDVAFDAAIRALDATERAANSVAVEVVSGTRAGQPEAVKLLRVAGAAAWWVSLDGTAAGTAQQSDGVLQLTAAADEPTRQAITRALAQAEGRSQPTIVVLPTPAATTKATP